MTPFSFITWPLKKKKYSFCLISERFLEKNILLYVWEEVNLLYIWFRFLLNYWYLLGFRSFRQHTYIWCMLFWGKLNVMKQLFCVLKSQIYNLFTSWPRSERWLIKVVAETKIISTFAKQCIFTSLLVGSWLAWPFNVL